MMIVSQHGILDRLLIIQKGSGPKGRSVSGMIEIVHGDITKMKVDVIVNAANEYLKHGGGVARAIARAGGPPVINESERWIKEHGSLSVGDVAITTAGRLPARWIIHVVGPRGTRPDLLRKAITNVMETVLKLGGRSVALPAVSCGIFGFDKELGTRIIYEVSREYSDRLDIYLVSIDPEVIDLWKRWKKELG